MVIFLSILKIIGIVLLVFACVIAAVLFVPISYEFDGDIDEGKYTVRISWLFRLIRFRFQFQEKAQMLLWILFYRIDFTDPVKKEKAARRKEKRAARKKKRETGKHERRKEKRLKSRKKEREKAHAEIKLDGESEKAPVQDQAKQEAVISKSAVHEESSSSGEEKADSTQNTVSRGKFSAGSRKHTVTSVKEKITGAVNLLRYLREHQILGTIWPRFLAFLIRIRPRKLCGELEFGFDDPSVTGQVLGGIAMIPFLYQTNLTIIPDFEAEKPYIRGNVYVKGHMLCIHFLILVIRMLLDKNIRSLLGSFRKKK